MTTDRPHGLLGRLANLLRGIFAVWIRDGEHQNPRAVYEAAILERTQQYHALKEAVAGILYMRNKLEAEIAERRAEIARLHDDVRRSVAIVNRLWRDGTFLAEQGAAMQACYRRLAADPTAEEVLMPIYRAAATGAPALDDIL